jgi:hypothetical protein
MHRVIFFVHNSKIVYNKLFLTIVFNSQGIGVYEKILVKNLMCLFHKLPQDKRQVHFS